MKQMIYFVSIISLFLAQCGKIELRVQNEYDIPLYNFSVGSVDYDTVDINETTEYKSIESGTHAIYIGNDSTGSVTITLKDYYPNVQYTLQTSSKDGKYKLIED